jgi:flagellar hook-length control protein FliK
MPASQIAPVVVSLAHGSSGSQHLTVRLDPPDLGNVQIRLERPADAPARIEITAQRPETLALLQRDQPHLQQALDQAGIPAEGRTLSFHLGPQDQSPEREGQNRNGASPAMRFGPQDSDTDEAPRPASPVQRWWRVGLDITA